LKFYASRRFPLLIPDLGASELDRAALEPVSVKFHRVAWLAKSYTLTRPVHLNGLDWTCSRGPGGAVEQIGFSSYFGYALFFCGRFLDRTPEPPAILVDELHAAS